MELTSLSTRCQAIKNIRERFHQTDFTFKNKKHKSKLKYNSILKTFTIKKIRLLKNM